MPDQDTKFLTYLKAFFKDLLTGMSGPLSVPFAALALWVSSRSQKILYACLASVCAVFGSYRVWRNERQRWANEVEKRDTEIAALRRQIATEEEYTEITLSTEGELPSQFIKVAASRVVTVSRMTYMMSNETPIADQDVNIQGKTVEILVEHGLLTKLWNMPRSDMRNYDHAGPAKIEITLSVGGKVEQLKLPVMMDNVMVGNTYFRKIAGSKVFYVGGKYSRS